MSATVLEATNVGNKRKKIDDTRIRDMFLLGFTAASIGAAFGITRRAVRCRLRNAGLIPGRYKRKREVLSDGKVCCSICRKSKKASDFGNGSSYCSSCGYGQAAMQSNQDMDQAIHIRNVWFRNRAKRLHIPYDLTDEQLTELYVRQDGRCAYCREPMVLKLGIHRSGSSASIERLIPQTLGGTYTLKNVVWVHFVCNARRCALTGERLKARFPEVSKAIEHVAQERQLELPFPTDSHIDVTKNPGPQPAGENQRGIKAIPSLISAHTGVCSLCSLPGGHGGLMSIPGVPGHYCSVGCIEYRLFGPGKCRWCGFRLDSSQLSFCSDQCRLQNDAAPFGSGMRFVLWLSRHEPRLFADLVGKEIPTGIVCLECGDSLGGKRRDSLFCGAKCRRRFSRSRNNPATNKRGDYPGDEASVCVIAGGGDARDVQSVGREF